MHRFSPQLFADARRQDRLVLALVVAPWNHWSQLLERETLLHPEVRAVLDADYLTARLDRDEAPEFDRRLQEGAQLLGVAGGWPLCVLFTPDGGLAFGVTYLPPVDDPQARRKGLASVLREVATAWREQPAKLRELGNNLAQVLGRVEAGERTQGAGNETLATEAVRQVLRLADPHYAGLQSEGAKFPHPTMWELLLTWAGMPVGQRDTEVREARAFTARSLTDMGLSGLHDQLGDGFHRYCTDPYWNVPEFEKLASDNAALLRVYSQAARMLGDPYFARVAEGTARWLLETLLSGDGGFYHAQAAARPGDAPGLYYGWTLRELEEVLEVEAARAFSLYFGVHKQGDLPPPHQVVNVLRVTGSLADVADQIGVPPEEAERLIQQAADTLIPLRRHRASAPLIDERLFTATTAEVAYSLLQFARALPDCPLAAQAMAQATKALDRLLRDAYEPGQGLRHRLDEATPRQQPGGEPRRWLLEDQAWGITAWLSGWATTGRIEYREAARDVLAWCNRHLWDREAGGYRDVLGAEPPGAGGTADGDGSAEPGAGAGAGTGAWPAILTVERRPVVDSPAASGNGLMLRALVQWFAVTNDEGVQDRARWVAEGLGGLAEQRGFLAATLCLGAAELEEPPATAIVVGPAGDATAEALWQAARRHAPLNAHPFRLDPDDPRDQPLIAAHGVELVDGRPALYVYAERHVKEPITEPSAVGDDTFTTD